MPYAPRRPCKNAMLGCRAYAVPGQARCERCAAAYDRQRGTAHERGYDARWARYSRAFRQQFPLCGGKREDAYPSTASQCARDGLVRVAQVTHHIRPHKGDQMLFWDPRNHEALCRTCHDALVDEGDFGR